MLYTRFCLAIACGLTLPAIALAVVTSDEAGSHVTTPGVDAFGVNVDGVVAIGWDDFPHGTGALITDRHVLTAAHLLALDEAELFGFPPTEDLTVTFDLPSGSVSMPIKSYVVPEQWTGNLLDDNLHDIAVIELAEDAPAEAPRYPLYGGQDEVGQQIVIVGYGMPGRGDVGMDFLAEFDGTKRAGLNRWEVGTESLFDGELLPNGLLYDFDNGLRANNALFFERVVSDLGFGDDEVIATTGDSGGPVFLGGAIGGVTSTGVITEDAVDADFAPFGDSSWGELAIDTRVSYYRDFLIEATDGQVVFVPEPSGLLLAAFGLVSAGTFLLHLRRKPDGPDASRIGSSTQRQRIVFTADE